LIEFDRTYLSENGDFSSNFKLVYYIKDPDYYKYIVTIKQTIYLGTIEAFIKEGIAMPFPIQTIFFKEDVTS